MEKPEVNTVINISSSVGNFDNIQVARKFEDIDYALVKRIVLDHEPDADKKPLIISWVDKTKY